MSNALSFIISHGPQSTQRRGRPAQLAPAPPFPGQASALLALDSHSLQSFVHSLALASQFSLSTPSTRGLLKLALYSFTLRSEFGPVLFPEGAPPLEAIDDRWLLRQSQGAQAGSEYSASRRGKVCGHVFKAGECVYRCRDCSLDATCVLCAKCFHASSHTRQGHDVTFSIHSGAGAGCCDCGDGEAFKDGCQRDCKYHGLGEEDQVPVAEADAQPNAADVERLKLVAGQTLRTVIDWMLSVLDQSPDELKPPKTVADIIAASSPAPFARNSPMPTEGPTGGPPSTSTFEPNLPRAVEEFNSVGQLPLQGVDDGLGAVNDRGEFELPSYSSSTSRGKARETSPDASPAGPWSVVLWNDEKHSFEQVISQVSRAAGVTEGEAKAVAQRVDSHGRDVVYISLEPDQVVWVANKLAQIDLAVSVRSAVDTFYEQVAGEVVGFMKDLCAAKVGGEGGVFTSILAQVLLENVEGKKYSRFQKLLHVDFKLWKEARRGLSEVYVSLLGVSPQVKLDVSVHFAQMYAKLAEAYLIYDREHEWSIITFAVQIFTVPSVSAHLVSTQHMLSQITSILFGFFTEQRAGRSLVLPPNPATRRIDVESPSFKQKRYFQVFSDLNHLIASPGVQKIICESAPLMEELASFLDLFTGMNPNTRAVNTHVEYESDSWVTAFNLTIQLARLCRSFGEAYKQATSLELARGLSSLLARMAGPRATIHNVDFGGQQHQLIDFNVSQSPISFHHPLAWLFAEMVKNIRQLDQTALNAIGLSSLAEIALGRAGPLHFLAAMDHPLRTVALVAQTRAGLWVRNGFSMRAQQLHYVQYSLRENTYDQDLTYLQAALVIIDPALVLLSIVDRFQLREWLGGEDEHPSYEPGQAMTMAEELLYVLIVLLSDKTVASGQSDALSIRRELVHRLVLGSASYSKIMREVSERFADEPALDRILSEVATFKPPVGTSDQGIYTLKKEAFSEVDPYFAKYSRNEREEADKLVREQLKRVGGHGEDPVIVPPALDIAFGPFKKLSEAFSNEVLHQVIFFGLVHGKARGALFSEVLVDEALHLAMLALVEQPDRFAQFAARREFPLREGPHKSLVQVLVDLEEDERMKLVRHKVRWCLDKLAQLVGEEVNALRKVVEVSQANAADALDAKRQAAKARQAAIMSKFAQAQKTFFDTNDDIDDDGDDDGDEAMAGEGKAVSLGSCIVCQDELDASRPFGALALVQASNLIRLSPEGRKNGPYQKEILAMPSSLDRDQSAIRPFGIASERVPVNADDDTGDGVSPGFPQSTQSGLHASACGHMMHLDCFETYQRTTIHRHTMQPGRCHPENVGRSEFICPLCKSLGNVLLPVKVDDRDFSPKLASVDERGVDAWASVARDPHSLALELGVEPDQANGYVEISRRLQLRRVSHVGLEAWAISHSVSELMLKQNEGAPTGQSEMVDKLLHVAETLMHELDGPELDERSPQLAHELVAYTVSSIEVASRGVLDGPGGVNEATERMLQSLLGSLGHLADLMGAKRGKEAGKQFFALAVVPHLGGLFAPKRSLLQLNPLAAVIELAAVHPRAFYQAAAFAFYTQLAQTFVRLTEWIKSSGELAVFDPATEPGHSHEEYASLAAIRQVFVGDASAVGRDTALWDSPGAELTLGKYLAVHMTIFVRRVAIIRRATFDEQPDVDDEVRWAEGSELARLLELLRIPTPAQVFDRTGSGASALQEHLVLLRESIPAAYGSRMSRSALAPLEHPVIYELIGLPHRLDTMAGFAVSKTCERCGTVPSSPALCLYCGEVVCNQSYCCMDGEEEAVHGECNTHMWTCGGTSAVFFSIKKNSILFLYTDKGTFGTPPYLDAHGKVDYGAGRSRSQFPQYLHQTRYDEIRRVWLNQGVGTLVARKLDAVTDHGGWTTM